MAQVNKNLILDKVEETGYPYYIVYELDGKTRLDQNIEDTEANPTKTRQQLEDFFNSAEGTVIVQLQAFDNMQGKPANRMLKMQTRLTGMQTMQTGVNGANGTDIERLMNLQAENHRQQLDHINEQHKRDLEILEIRRELQAQKESSFLDKHGDKIAGLLPYLINGLNPAAAAPIINGTPTEAAPITELLERLAAADPNYLQHLEQLVILAETNSTMYAQGVAMIGNLVQTQTPTA
jgi:hypothetical protein